MALVVGQTSPAGPPPETRYKISWPRFGPNENADDAPAVVQRLLGKLARGLGVEARYLPYSVDSLLQAPE